GVEIDDILLGMLIVDYFIGEIDAPTWRVLRINYVSMRTWGLLRSYGREDLDLEMVYSLLCRGDENHIFVLALASECTNRRLDRPLMQWLSLHHGCPPHIEACLRSFLVHRCGRGVGRCEDGYDALIINWLSE
ncbi:hypothetical protein L195_g014044, partial [Trifolium pratense]